MARMRYDRCGPSTRGKGESPCRTDAAWHPVLVGNSAPSGVKIVPDDHRNDRGAGPEWVKLGQHKDVAASNFPVGAADSLSQDEVAPGTVTLAVLGFDNHAKDPALDGFRQGLRDMLVTDLARVSKLVVSRLGRCRTGAASVTR